MKALVITIDGPSGAGKSTISRMLAQRLGYNYVDTGALYRGVAVAALREKCPPDDDTRLARICRHLRFRFEDSQKGQRLFMNDLDITEQIGTPEVTALASAVSARPVVRKSLLGIQREAGKNGGVVFEGRDMGTVVLPEANVKFYLDAEHDTRALRRYRELVAKGTKISLGKVTKAMKKRDQDDSSRSLAPLKPANDAIRIDSTFLEIEQVVELMFGLTKAKLK
jgi:cytidylate kinase